MSFIPRALPLPIHAPTSPDQYVCSPAYGTRILPFDCQNTVDVNWPKGTTPVRYYFDDPSPSAAQKLPIVHKQGSCTVSIEEAGPDFLTRSYISIAPNVMRGLAGFLIQTCANENHGLGGFVTVGLGNAESYLASLDNSIAEDTQNNLRGKVTNGAFMTISINGPNETDFEPGNNDPLIAWHLSNYARAEFSMYEQWLERKQFFLYQAIELRDRAVNMIRGGTHNWWNLLSESDDSQSTTAMDDSERETDDTATSPLSYAGHDDGKMTYQCDATLGGGPDPTDCEKLSWSGLKPPDSVETLQANTPAFYSQGTCGFGISSPIPLTITWAHILAAFNTLNTFCVQNPIAAVKGGRAYYGQQAVSTWINGKRDSVGGVNGSDALPQGINATIFRHDPTSLPACEWTLAQEGKNISMCEAG